jgi:hypothetical protein
VSNSSTAPLPSKAPHYFAILAFFFTYLFYAFIWVRQGFSTEDAGFLIGLSWRVFDGQVPYRDFIHVRPPLSIYIHALPIFCGPYALFADRLLSLAQLAMAAIAGTCVLLGKRRLEVGDDYSWTVALAAFVLTAHNWPAFGWPTVDAVLFSALSLWALTNRRFALAGALAVAALLCKQNFLAFAIFGLAYSLMAGPAATLRYCLGCAGFLLPVFGYLFSQGALGAMLQQVLSAGELSDIWDAGFAEYARDIAARAIIVALVASSAVGLGVWWRKRSIPLALTYGYATFATLALIVFASRVLGAAVAGASYDYMMVEFSESSAMLVVAGCLALIWLASKARSDDHESRPELLTRATALAGLFVIAWTSSISRGYQIPALFAVPLLAPLLLWGPPVVARRPLQVLTAVALVAFGMAYAYPYGESLRFDCLGSIPERFHGAALIRTSPLTIAKLNEVAAWSDRDRSRPLVILPAFTPASFLLQRHPAAPLDWVVDAEVPVASRDTVVRAICERHARVLVERTLAKRVLESEGDPMYSAVLATVVANWPRRGRGAHFDIYEAPDAC